MDEEQRNKRIIEKARNEEDEYSSNKKTMESYYATAHRIRERIVKQHSSLGEFNIFNCKNLLIIVVYAILNRF